MGKEKKLETLAERIDNFLHMRYNELVEKGEVNVDFETWGDWLVKEWLSENNRKDGV
jgi:predicted transcriptional regulator